MNLHFYQRFIILGISFLLASCVSSGYTQLPSANYSYRVKSLVMHFTAIDYQKSVEALVNEGYVSSHYLVPESNDPSYRKSELEVLQLVDEHERAWHAGRSYWQGRTGLNDSSIGIEIVNVPQCFDDEKALAQAGMASRAEHGPNRLCVFPDFDPKQIELVIELSQDILSRNPDITPTAVVGHSDIAPSRKNDPGPRFPWYQLYQAGIGAWYDEASLAAYWQRFNHAPVSVGLLQAALSTYGYGIIETGIIDQQTIDTISAFQMHFLPWQVSGNPDSRTAAAVFALIEKYFPDALPALLTRYELESDSAIKANTASVITKQGQVDAVFPLVLSDSREYVNNRTQFIAYAGQGDIRILPMNASSADIYINEQKLNIAQPFAAEQYEYSLAKRTHDGINSLRVDNIQPADASLQLIVPYPSLRSADESNNTKSPLSSAFDFSEVDKLINTDVSNGFPGAVLLVLHQGKIVKHSAYGYAALVDGKPSPMQKDTSFDLASNTKVFATTLAIMHLVEQNKLALDAPVSRYLPEYVGAGREGRTVADLLAHASGYDSEVQFYKRENPLGGAFHSLRPELTGDILLSKVEFVAGRQTQQQYSDTNFMILGLLIERLTQRPLDEYLEEEIYQALGLDSLMFNPLKKGQTAEQFAATEIKGNTRSGNIEFEGIRDYVLRGEVHDEKAFYSMEGVAGHAGLFGNARDLAVLAQLMLNQGGYDDKVLFSPATLARFVSPRYQNNSFGLGWRLALDQSTAWHFGPYASSRAFGHTGWTGTATVIDPAYELAIILLTNKKHTPVQKRGEALIFSGDEFETGRYGSVVSKVYEAILQGVK
ncbi:penicillin binding protein PBP4B [Glaciecola siphonariae]|uniref:Penicillin binding protein PBP4B n=1 Tax=Glaciecola siphonariae TaxID=521012 RepID=A0ABV9LWV5_9ALTE